MSVAGNKGSDALLKLSADVSTGPYPDRQIRVGVHVTGRWVVEETILEPGSEVSLGADASATLVWQGWAGPTVLIVEAGALLRLGPGMRIHMCDEAGGRRVKGTFEELLAQGITFPMPVPVSRLNISPGQGVMLLVEFQYGTHRRMSKA